MFQTHFYSLISFSSNESSLEAALVFHPEHVIFAGHFPGQPVVPGVCMLQMLKKCLEQAIGEKLLLTQALTIKFLSLLVPEAGQVVTLRAAFSLTPAVMVSSASLMADGEQFIKLSNAQYDVAKSDR